MAGFVDALMKLPLEYLFLAARQCREKPLLHFHGKTEHFYAILTATSGPTRTQSVKYC